MPRRTKEALVGTHENYMIRACRVSLERAQVAWRDAQDDQGHVGQHSEGPRARLVAPERMITRVVVAVIKNEY